MTRRKLLLGIGSGAGLALLAACGQATPMTVEAEKPAEEMEPKAAEEQAPAVEPYEIRVFTTSTWRLDESIGLDVVKEIEALNPGITVNATTETGNRMDKMVTAVSGGFPLDVGQSGFWQAQTLAVLGAVQPIDRFMRTSEVIKREEIWPALLRALTWEGETYGMPFGPDVRFLYSNDQVYVQSGLDPEVLPETWDDLEEVVKATFRKSGDQIDVMGIDVLRGTGGTHLWLVPMWQLGGETTAEDGRTITIDTPQALEALTWLKKVYDMQDGFAARDAFWGELGRYPKYHQLWADGRVANQFITGSERNTIIRPNYPDVEFNWAPFPRPTTGDFRTYGGCHTWFLTVASPDPDRAWKFLEHFGARDVNIRWSRHFDRLPIRPDVAGDPEYYQDDEFVKFQGQLMDGHRFILYAPGAPGILPLNNSFIPDVLTGATTAQEALKEAQGAMQTVLDDFLKEHGAA